MTRFFSDPHGNARRVVLIVDRRPTQTPARPRPCFFWKMPPYERSISATAMTVDRPCCNDRPVNIVHLVICVLLLCRCDRSRGAIMYAICIVAKLSSWIFVYHIMYNITIMLELNLFTGNKQCMRVKQQSAVKFNIFPFMLYYFNCMYFYNHFKAYTALCTCLFHNMFVMYVYSWWCFFMLPRCTRWLVTTVTVPHYALYCESNSLILEITLLPSYRWQSYLFRSAMYRNILLIFCYLSHSYYRENKNVFRKIDFL